MGIGGSKDDRGVRVLQALPPGFLDEKGKDLRDKLDWCLEQNGWYFTIGGLALTVPICFRYKTERPFYVAAILSPMADMYYGTLRCTKENDAFAEHYRYLHRRYQTPAWKHDKQEQQDQQEQQPDSWQKRQQQQWQQQQRQLQQGSVMQSEEQQQQQQQAGLQGNPSTPSAVGQDSQQQRSKWWWASQ